MRRGGRNEEDGGIPCRASLPALSALFAGERDSPCFVASVFADFRWQAGLRGGGLTEIPGQARNEVEVAPE